jgi:hypothetical protein
MILLEGELPEGVHRPEMASGASWERVAALGSRHVAVPAP